MENTEQPKKKKAPLIIFGIIGTILAIMGIKSAYFAMTHETTDNAQVESVAVPIVSRLSGYIDSFTLLDYQSVTAGSTLVKIDNSEYILAVEQSKADVLSAKADLANAEALLNNNSANNQLANSNIELQNVRIQKAVIDLNRDKQLYKEGSITLKQLENSQSNYDAAIKQKKTNTDQLALSVSQMNNIKAQIEKSKAAIAAKEAALRNAELRLSYTTIKSPINGKVGKTNLQVGQFVQPGQPLFTIINNDEYWITANFKETQIAKLSEGMEVDIKIDGYPDLVVKGKIANLSDATGARFTLLPPDNATGNFVKVTQRVPVKIAIQNVADVKKYLKAGLSVSVEVKTK